MPVWNSAQYLRFARERTQPSRDLVGRVETDPVRRALDLGSGPGNSTAVVAGRFPGAQVTGVDNSPAMLDSARAAHPELDFREFDLASDNWTPLGSGYDLVFSNACIQWLPDHPALLAKMMGLLRLGGSLAVQVPLVQHQEMQQIFHEVATDPRWADRLAQVQIPRALEPRDYFDILQPLASDLQIWRTDYQRRMRSIDDIIAWYEGSSLRPYLQLLTADDGRAFENRVRELATDRLVPQADGEILLPFPRVFFVAVR